MFASSSFHKESWTVGTLFHPMLWNLLPSTRSRTDWMTTSRRNPKTSHPPESNKTRLFQYMKQFGTLYR